MYVQLNKMKPSLRRNKTLRKRGGRIDPSRTKSRTKSRGRSRSPRSRSPSLSPGRVRIVRSHQIQDQGNQGNQGNQAHPVQDEPIAVERWSYKTKCNNGEEHTSMHEYTRIDAMRAAREYCRTRGGVNGRVEYTSHTRML